MPDDTEEIFEAMYWDGLFFDWCFGGTILAILLSFAAIVWFSRPKHAGCVDPGAHTDRGWLRLICQDWRRRRCPRTAQLPGACELAVSHGGDPMVDSVLELLEHFAIRPGMYVQSVEVSTVQGYLLGFETGCSFGGLSVSREVYEEAALSLGWKRRATGIVWHMRAKSSMMLTSFKN
jgi:hypothetical protein